MTPENVFPLGKLPMDVLASVLAKAPVSDPRVVLGPGVGLDCAVVDIGEQYLVFKSEPITFATDEIGWYSIQVSCNDIATTGATPRWYLSSLLLPENKTTPALVEQISAQIFSACREMGLSVLGGHTEITYNLDRPILVATLIGEVAHDRLVTPRGACPGDRILLTKGVPVEGTALLAREFNEQLDKVLSPAEKEEARRYLYQPGISIVRDARLALRAGRVNAMHDPTEGGLSSALWELAMASGQEFHIDSRAVPVAPLSRKICAHFGLNPLETIASGALILCVPAGDSDAVCAALQAEDILCVDIGEVMAGRALVFDTSRGEVLPRPDRDEITRVYERAGN